MKLINSHLQQLREEDKQKLAALAADLDSKNSVCGERRGRGEGTKEREGRGERGVCRVGERGGEVKGGRGKVKRELGEGKRNGDRHW